jgi:hypothetical protein
MSQDFNSLMNMVTGQTKMEPEELYRRLGRIIETSPMLFEDGDAPLFPSEMEWIGQASALLSMVGDLTLIAETQVAVNGLHSPRRAVSYQKLLLILHKALSLVELRCPPRVQGAFIPAGSPYDAFEAVAKIFRTAKKSILIVDPYMDATVLK